MKGNPKDTFIDSSCHGSGAVNVRWQVGWFSEEKTINGTHYAAIPKYESRVYFFDCKNCASDYVECKTCEARQTRFMKFEQARDAAINEAEHRLFALRSELQDKKIPAKPPKGTAQVWADIISRLYLSDSAHKWREAIRKVWNPPLMFPQECEKEKAG
jgi:hypothetical protein